MRHALAFSGFLLLATAFNTVAADPLQPLLDQPDKPATVELVLAGDTQPTTLKLTPVRIWTRDARIEVHSSNGMRELTPPDDRYFRGNIDGEAGSRAMIRISSDGSRLGIVASNGGTWLLNDDGVFANPDSIALHEQQSGSEPQPFSCQALDAPQDQPMLQPASALGAPAPGGHARQGQNFSGASASFEARVAVETDHEYLQRLGGDTEDASRYMADVFAFISGIYEAETDTALTISYLGLWEDSNDPWDQSGTSCALSEFGYYWNNNRQDVERSIAHFVSGKSMGGGIAWMGVLCGGAFNTQASCSGLPSSGNFGGAYGVSANISGSFNPDSPASVWDMTVIAHEIGHNFSSPHTHCYGGIGGNSNPVDGCYAGEGQNNPSCHSGTQELPGPMGQGSGTLMSYCHLLQGGQSNISPTFGQGHPYGTEPGRVPSRMAAHVQQRASQNPACLAPQAAEEGFTLSASNTQQSLCLANGEQPEVIRLSTQAVGGFSGDISFIAVPQLPNGFSSSFSQSPISPGDSTDLSLTLDSGVAAGQYSFDMQANADGVDSQSVTLTFDVADVITASSNLQTPADNAIDVASRPSFSWSSVDGASGYRIQVADNPGFSAPVTDETVAATGYQMPSALDPEQTYYWRVRATGECGTADWSATRSFTTNQCSDILAENFDDELTGWTTSQAGDTPHWSLSTQRANSSPRTVFTAAPGEVSDRQLTGPSVAIPDSVESATLSFVSWMDIEAPNGNTCFDGATLEISRNGGEFQPISGDLLTERGYTGTLSSQYENPLGGSPAWCGNSNGFETLAADLSGFIGDTVRLRFRLGTDSSVGAEGWYIDDVTINACGGLTTEPTRHALNLSIQGQGQVRSADGAIECTNDCSTNITEGESISLQAIAANGYSFASWSGACSGQNTSCQLTMNQARNVTARFDAVEPQPESVFSDRFEGN